MAVLLGTRHFSQRYSDAEMLYFDIKLRSSVNNPREKKTEDTTVNRPFDIAYLHYLLI